MEVTLTEGISATAHRRRPRRQGAGDGQYQRSVCEDRRVSKRDIAGHDDDGDPVTFSLLGAPPYALIIGGRPRRSPRHVADCAEAGRRGCF